MITLNVAINFYSNALLSLLISNQFVEIKQNVFKRYEKENLFQLTCGGKYLNIYIQVCIFIHALCRYCREIPAIRIFIHYYTAQHYRIE
jgi:hypothetical protein